MQIPICSYVSNTFDRFLLYLNWLIFYLQYLQKPAIRLMWKYTVLYISDATEIHKVGVVNKQVSLDSYTSTTNAELFELS